MAELPFLVALAHHKYGIASRIGRKIARHADGVGPWKRHLVGARVGDSGETAESSRTTTAPTRFVERHAMLAEAGWFLAGNRVLLSESFTRRALADGMALHAWGALSWARAWLTRDANRLMPLVSLGDGAWRKRQPDRWEGVKTCNLSAWRRDLVAVNGLDESYTGWGMEDSDLVVRLRRAGVRHKSARFAAPVFHLWHRENDRSRLPENQARLREVLSSTQVRSRVGLDQYSSVAP